METLQATRTEMPRPNKRSSVSQSGILDSSPFTENKEADDQASKFAHTISVIDLIKSKNDKLISLMA